MTENGSGHSGQQSATNLSVERRNFGLFVRALEEVAKQSGNTTVLVAGCGDGFEVEWLARAGFDVIALDYSENMLAATRRRLDEQGLSAELRAADVTHLKLADYGRDFAGVVFGHVAQFIPVVKDDGLVEKTIGDLAWMAQHGVFYMSTTQYPEAVRTRRWKVGNRELGDTTYFARPLEKLVKLLNNTAVQTEFAAHFDAGSSVTGDHKNHYLVGLGRNLTEDFVARFRALMSNAASAEVPTTARYQEAVGVSAIRQLSKSVGRTNEVDLAVDRVGPAGLQF